MADPENTYAVRAERSPEGDLLGMKVVPPHKDAVEVPECLHDAVTRYAQVFLNGLSEDGDAAMLNSHRGTFLYTLTTWARKQAEELSEQAAALAKIGHFSSDAKRIPHRSRIKEAERALEKRAQELESIARREQQEQSDG